MIKSRIEQPAVNRFMNLEELALKAIKNINLSKEVKLLESNFSKVRKS